MNAETVRQQLVEALEADIDEELARRRDPFLHRLRCDGTTPDCPTEPSIAYACRACAEIVYGLTVSDEEAAHQSQLLAAAEEIWRRPWRSKAKNQ